MKSSFFADLGDDVSKAPSGGFFSDIPEVSKARSVISAAPKGIAKGMMDIAQLGVPLAFAEEEFPERQERIRGAAQAQRKMEEKLERALPTRQENVERMLERGGRLAPSVALGVESVPLKLAQLAGGTLAGHLAEEAGLGEGGQGVSEAVGVGLGPLLKGATSKLAKAARSVPEKMESGLTKLALQESKGTKYAALTPKKQEALVKGLDKEASSLVKKSVEKHVPLAKEIERGVDFESKFAHDFGHVRQMAKKFNPDVDIAPIEKMIANYAETFSGIPRPNPAARKAIADMQAFSNNPQVSLSNLLKVYRDNNKKIRNISETARLKGTQQEYVDFLRDFNRSIASSFEATLPSDSSWMKMFKEANRSYAEAQNAKDVMHGLKGFLSETPTAAQVEKLATDPMTQKKLSLKMGPEGSKEIIQISKDLKSARDAVKRMSTGQFSKFDSILPLAYLIPGVGKIIASTYGAAKSVKGAKLLYGWILSKPSRREAYRQAIDSVLRDDIQGYKKAALVLLQEMKEE